MAADSKLVTILTYLFALCGGAVGALIFFAYRNHFGFAAFGQVAFVLLGAILGFGGVWLCFWIGQNLFVE
jgi:hypothetical protein